MDVLKFLQGGNETPNPNYNPKTKKGRLEPPTLVDYSPGTTTSDRGRTALFSRIAGQSYNLNQYNIDEYAPYDVYVNPVDDPEKLNKERAINQSNWEQGLRMVGQIGNEVVLGTAIGFADMADAFYNMVSDESNDYQNDVTALLEDTKNSIDERLAIYRENPNAAWDVSDFAWWASNVPSIASSLTLMIPSTALAKVGSVVGKGLRLNKLANKIANGLKLSEKASAITARAAESIAIGVPSRYLENYQEARQTYQNVEDYANNQLASMSKKQREEFYNNNPQYRNKSDDEIIKDIAKNSADITFTEDWINVFFDVLQVYSLKNLWKNAISGSTTSKITALNKAFNANIDDAAAITSALTSKTTKQAITSTLKNVGDDIIHGVRAEWTEGIEEAINYIASQNGMYNAKKVFDKDTPIQNIKSYLQDPMLWEQAFWGALGGVVFSGVVDKAGSIINKKLNKEWISAEKQKEEEILSRTIAFQTYKERLDLIAGGKNPFDTTKEGDFTTYRDLVTGTENELRTIAEKKYMDDIIINAANAGNFGLLEASVNSKEFNESITKKLNLKPQQGTELIERFKTELKNVKNEYNTALNKVNRLGGGFEIGRIIASQIIRAKSAQKNYDNILDWADAEFNKELTNNHIDNLDHINAKNGIYKHYIDVIKKDIENTKHRADIDEKVKQGYIEQLNKKLEVLNKLYNPFNVNDSIDVTKEAVKLQNDYNEVFKALINVVNAEINAESNYNQMNFSDESIKAKITYYNNFFNQSRRKIVDKAMSDLRQAYKDFGKEYVDNVILDINNGNDPKRDKAIRNAYTALELDSKGNEHLKLELEQLAEIANLDNDVNSNPSPEDIVPDNVDADIIVEEDESDDAKVDADVSSTGGRSSEPITSTETPIVPSTENLIQNPVQNSVESNDQQFNDQQSNSVEEQSSEQKEKEAISTPKQESSNKLPEDDFERGLIGTELIYDYIADLELRIGRDALTSDLLSVREDIIKDLIEKGFEKDEATIIVNNVINGLTGGSLSSSVMDDSSRTLLLNAMYATVTGNENSIEAIMEDFANSVDSEGNTRGKTVNGKVYLSIGQLVEYIDSVTGNKIIKNYLFNQLKNYLYGSTNNQGKYRATDEATIKKLTNRQFVQYVDEIAKSRLERLKSEYTNNVNIEYVNNEVAAKEFTSIKIGDYVDFSIDEQQNRINILSNDIIIGYIGIPTFDSNGNYTRVNKGWIYDIHVENGVTVSPLKDFLIDILDGDKVDEEFLGHLYELAVKDEITQEELVNLWDEVETKYYNEIQQLTTLEASFTTAEHLINITKYIFNQPYENSHTASINRWFNILLNSYDQAATILKGDFKGKLKVGNIKYGILNTIEDPNGDWNDIQDTVIDYNENVNKLGVVVGGQVYLNGENKPTIIENLTSNGMPVISIPSSDGTSLYAFCKQVPINSDLLKGDAKNIVNAIKLEVLDLARQYMSNEISFSELSNRLNDIFGNNKLINGDRNTGLQISINPTNIGFYVKGAYFNGKDYAFTINSDAGNYRRNIVINDPNIVNNDFRFSAKSNNYGITVHNVANIEQGMKGIIDEMFKYAQFAVSKDFINDGNKTNSKTNNYIYRENGKTVINIGGRTYSYNNYQDFIISNGLVRTKLAKSYDEFTAGNWRINNLAKLDIIYELQERPPVEDTPITEQLSEFMLDDTFNAINYNAFDAAITSSNLTKGLKRYFANDQNALDYINALQKIGIIPKNVNVVDNLVDNNGNQINAVYHTATDVIELNRSAIVGQRVYRVVNIILHESLHRQLYTKYNKEQALAKVRPIYDKFKSWLNEQSEDVKKDLSPYLFEGQNEDVAIEEFMVESITSNKLMTALNSIVDTDRNTTKKKSLFSKLLEVIAEMLGINIDEDSLLATARDAYASIKKMSNNNENNAQNADQISEEITTVDQADNPNEDNSQDYDYNDDSLDAGTDIFSSVEDYTARNMAELINGLPMDLQPEFARLLEQGTISFSCV